MYNKLFKIMTILNHKTSTRKTFFLQMLLIITHEILNFIIICDDRVNYLPWKNKRMQKSKYV